MRNTKDNRTITLMLIDNTFSYSRLAALKTKILSNYIKRLLREGGPRVMELVYSEKCCHRLV